MNRLNSAVIRSISSSVKGCAGSCTIAPDAATNTSRFTATGAWTRIASANPSLGLVSILRDPRSVARPNSAMNVPRRRAVIIRSVSPAPAASNAVTNTSCVAGRGNVRPSRTNPIARASVGPMKFWKHPIGRVESAEQRPGPSRVRAFRWRRPRRGRGRDEVDGLLRTARRRGTHRCRIDVTADHKTDQPEQSVDFVMTDEGWFLGCSARSARRSRDGRNLHRSHLMLSEEHRVLRWLGCWARRHGRRAVVRLVVRVARVSRLRRAPSPEHA